MCLLVGDASLGEFLGSSLFSKVVLGTEVTVCDWVSVAVLDVD